MAAEYKCPKCSAGFLKLNEYNNRYECSIYPEIDYFQKEYFEHLYIKNSTGDNKMVEYKIGRVNGIGKKLYLHLNIHSGNFLFFNYPFISYRDEGKFFGQLDDIDSIDVVTNNQTIFITTRNMLPTIAGGVLFGGVGAIAGSLATSTQSKAVNNDSFTITFKFKTIEFPGIVFETNDKQLVFSLISTLEMLIKEKRQLQQMSTNEETPVEKEKEESDMGKLKGEMAMLKQMKEDGIVDEEEYQQLRKKIINKYSS